MKILYLSCHSILEYDDLRMFMEMGLDIFSHGAYSDPNNPGDNKRPAIGFPVDEELIRLAKENPKENMSQEFLDNFDVIYSSWVPDWILNNIDKMKDKIVIFRTIGQSIPGTERQIKQMRDKGVKVVRYSPAERNLEDYAGEDNLIRFYKDPVEFGNWNGNILKVMNVSQAMKKRGDFCHWPEFSQATDNLSRIIYGPGNEESEDWGGCLNYDDLKKAYREHRVYFYTGTCPASYTLGFIEAWMTGIPIVAVGPRISNNMYKDVETYEVHQLIHNGIDGFISDNIEELRNYCELLLRDLVTAKGIGDHGRQEAIRHFSRETIRSQWMEYFMRLGIVK